MPLPKSDGVETKTRFYGYLPTYLPTYVTYLRTYIYLPTTYLPTCQPASQPASLPPCLPANLPTPNYLPAMKINMSTLIWKLRFAIPRKSTRLYLSLTLVACDKVRLVDSSLCLF